MSRSRTRLFDLEIDEVSGVDRPANQHGLIAIAKSAEGEMPETDELELEHGQDYVDDEGNVFMFVELDDDGQPKPVDGIDFSMDGEDLVARDTEPELVDAGSDVGKSLSGLKKLGQNAAGRLGTAVKKNPVKAAAIGAGGAGVAGGSAYMAEARKDAGSAGTAVLEALSKAVSDGDRNEIVAKMADDLARTQAENAEIAKALDEERDIRITDAFVSKAAEYDIPVDPEVFGPILKACAEVLDDEQLGVLDEVLKSKALYDEIGSGGGAYQSDSFGEVLGVAQEVVGKSAGALTAEQAVTAVFDANPDAYDAYVAETNGR